MPQAVFERLCQYARQTAILESTLGLLEWDERTKMPSLAGSYRAEQIAHLTGMVHRRKTDPQLGAWLAELQAGPVTQDRHSDVGATIRELQRQFSRLVRVPGRLVEELSRTAVLAQQRWVEARRANDFASFLPLLEQVVRLTREKADALGFVNCRYDALLEDYEPGQTTAQIARVLESLRADLVPLVSELADAPRRPRMEILRRPFAVAQQEALSRRAAAAIGFDFERGRLDVTAHPFCCGAGPSDCRITTRYDERYFPTAFFGVLHEAGHGLYEQGLRADQYGLPPGAAASLGIHESQSRLWENFVGRSRPFWEYLFPSAQQAFPESLADVSLDDFYFAINDVRPSLIRVEADEATYNLHIIVRFELEQALLNEELPVAELPGAWVQKYREYLGIEPPDDAQGVMQDVHWSAALIGYFPTYALGNLYAAQLFESAEQALGGLSAHLARGEFRPLLEWLRHAIHQRGQCYSAGELVAEVTGRALSHQPLLAHLRRKFRPLYGLE